LDTSSIVAACGHEDAPPAPEDALEDEAVAPPAPLVVPLDEVVVDSFADEHAARAASSVRGSAT
jgi:hypothetical protein